MYVYRAKTAQGKTIERRFLTKRGARSFADSLLFAVESYEIVKGRRRYVEVCAPLLILAVVLFPSAALADEESQSSASAVPLAAGSVDSSGSAAPSGESSGNDGSSSGEQAEDERIDYRNVVNEQVVGDFYFVLCVDTVLLLFVFGALAYLAFKPAR